MTVPNEMDMARYWAELGRLRDQLARFESPRLRMFEGEAPDGALRDVTHDYVEGLRFQIGECERFLNLVKTGRAS
jgi:hypothetical protein